MTSPRATTPVARLLKMTVLVAAFAGIGAKAASAAPPTTRYEYWTAPFSEEGFSYRAANPGYYLAGYACSGRYCDNQMLLFASYDTIPLTPPNTQAAFTTTDNAPLLDITGSDELINSVACKGRYCDNVTLGRATGIGVAMDMSKAEWTGWISEEAPNNKYIAPTGWFIVGYECKGSYCDDRRFKVAPLAELPGPNITVLPNSRNRKSSGGGVLSSPTPLGLWPSPGPGKGAPRPSMWCDDCSFTTGVYRIKAMHSGKYMMPAGSTVKPGTPQVQADSSGHVSQQYIVLPVRMNGGEYVVIMGTESGQVIKALGDPDADGLRVVQHRMGHACSKESTSSWAGNLCVVGSEFFEVIDTGTGNGVYLRSLNSGQYLAVANASMQAGASFVLSRTVGLNTTFAFEVVNTFPHPKSDSLVVQSCVNIGWFECALSRVCGSQGGNCSNYCPRTGKCPIGCSNSYCSAEDEWYQDGPYQKCRPKSVCTP